MIDILRSEEGNVLVEYALVLSLLSFAFIAGMLAIETAASSALTNVQSELLNFQLQNGL
jgi:Flp pilus assembly pilin Flp